MRVNGVDVPEDGKVHVITVVVSDGKTTTTVSEGVEVPVDCPHARGEFW